MNLRPHHALCIQKFAGRGYDGRFTEHMTQICQTLRNFPETQVTITSGCDDLCSACPNNHKGSCSTLQKVTVMDANTLRALNLKPGDTLPWHTLAVSARETIFSTDEFQHICKSCEWYGLCLATPII